MEFHWYKGRRDDFPGENQLCAKHQRQGAGIRAYTDEYLYETLGLVRLERTTRNLPGAKA